MSSETTDKKKSSFTQVPNKVRGSKHLKPSEKLVLIELRSYVFGDKRICFPSQETMAANTGLDRKTVRNALRNLEQRGFFNVLPEKRYRGGHQYQLHLDRWEGLAQVPDGEISPFQMGKSHPSKTVPDGEIAPTNNSKQFNIQPKKSLASPDESNLYPAAEAEVGLGNGNGTVTCPVTINSDGEKSPSEIPKKRPSLAEHIRECRIAPDGSYWHDGKFHSDFDAAVEAVALAGGEKLNPGSLCDLVDSLSDRFEDPAAVIWFHSKWYPRRLASLKKPPDKPTPYFLKCVREDLPVNPEWPEFYRPKHAKLSDEMREILADHPTTDSPQEWLEWQYGHEDRKLYDVPPHLRTAVFEALRKPENFHFVDEAVALRTQTSTRNDLDDEDDEIPF